MTSIYYNTYDELGYHRKKIKRIEITKIDNGYEIELHDREGAWTGHHITIKLKEIEK
jgi:hypothetical protein